jgi:hypothetical protein
MRKVGNLRPIPRNFSLKICYALDQIVRKHSAEVYFRKVCFQKLLLTSFAVLKHDARKLWAVMAHC